MYSIPGISSPKNRNSLGHRDMDYGLMLDLFYVTTASGNGN